ncbi:MAG: lipocalin family protein [Ignavibacteriae bacterium]|nr:lipocalin family protein [Ignavibacteriota bacterium]
MNIKLKQTICIIALAVLLLSGCSEDEPTLTENPSPDSPIIGNWKITNIVLVNEGIKTTQYDTIESSGELRLNFDQTGFVKNEKYLYGNIDDKVVPLNWTYNNSSLGLAFSDSSYIPVQVIYLKNGKMKFVIPFISNWSNRLYRIALLERERR